MTDNFITRRLKGDFVSFSEKLTHNEELIKTAVTSYFVALNGEGKEIEKFFTSQANIYSSAIKKFVCPKKYKKILVSIQPLVQLTCFDNVTISRFADHRISLHGNLTTLLTGGVFRLNKYVIELERVGDSWLITKDYYPAESYVKKKLP